MCPSSTGRPAEGDGSSAKLHPAGCHGACRNLEMRQADHRFWSADTIRRIRGAIGDRAEAEHSDRCLDAAETCSAIRLFDLPRSAPDKVGTSAQSKDTLGDRKPDPQRQQRKRPPYATRLNSGKGGSGGPRRIRTPDPLIRSQVLYPAELSVHCGGVYWGWAQGATPKCHKPAAFLELSAEPRKNIRKPKASVDKSRSDRAVPLGKADVEHGALWPCFT